MDDGSEVHLFSLAVGELKHVVHFPLLSAAFADLQQSNFRFMFPILISTVALVISILGMGGNAT
jgi:hypothetical protein